MTIVETLKGSVGTWAFRDKQNPIERYDRKALDRLVELLSQAADVLEEHELFFPTEIELVPAEGKSVGNSLFSRLIPLESGCAAKQLLGLFTTLFNEIEREHGFVYPNLIKIFGKGIVLNAAGERATVANAAWLCGLTPGWHVVEVSTQCDAWLPHALDAQPQPEIYQANMPRLERALRAVGDRLATPLEGEDTSFAISDGLRLKNQSYDNGEVVDCSILLES